jgi:hypothetical protein
VLSFLRFSLLRSAAGKVEKNGEHAQLSYNPTGEPKADGSFFVYMGFNPLKSHDWKK